MLNALGNPTRLRIFHLLAQAGPEGMAVGTLVETIGIPGSTLSHHIAKLAKTGLVRQDRHATTLMCHVEENAVSELSAYLVAKRIASRR
ncbi:metalloregulator ArsR/SmtB family transcription factor [Aurantimonas sp. MSK8Z-1]|nr:metalloregulator ArsR/SmtB family transcription factor [Aurantimonas sp. CSK15Z-1]MCW4114335.1 metalloregulator ArsR/SmtB family transcription factor [Aurantimonas sp. MSK8Z-1]